MKKLVIMLAIAILFPGISYAGDGIIELKGSYFYPSERAFKDIYSGGLNYEGEATFRTWKNLELWAGISYFRKNGKLSLTKEKTSLQIIPIGAGIKYRFPAGNLCGYVGLGVRYFHSTESNVIGDVTKNGLGYIAKIGCYINVKGGWVIDIYMDYSYCQIEPPDFGLNIGGIVTGIGIGYKFGYNPYGEDNWY